MEAITIGRKLDNSIVVPDSYSTVSGYHATIYFEDGRCVFEDHSSNGSYINGTKLHYGKITISPNDVILLSRQYRLDNKMVFVDVNGPFENGHFYGRSTERYSKHEFPSRCQHPVVYAPQPPIIPEHGKTTNGHTDMDPENLHSFNFGAFIFGWLWGICNGVYIALLTLVPAINLIMSIVLGVKGNEWAWEKQKSTTTPESFVQSQKRWSKAALIVLVISFALIILYILLFALLFS